MRLLEDIKTIFRKDWKLFLLINAIYFGAIIAGALIAVAYPDLQLAMIEAAGQSFGAGGTYSGVGEAYASGNVVMAAIYTFLVNLIPGTLLMIVLPSLIIPFWALLFCAFRALLWGIMLVVPVPGVMPFSTLLPHYLTLILEGEAYIVAMFACTRGLVALLKPKAFGTDSRLQAYKKSIIDTGKLLIVVAALLAVAATYEAVEVIATGGATGSAGTGGFGFYDEEFGANSSYSNWTQTIKANQTSWTTFDLPAGKLTRVHYEGTGGVPIDVIVMDKANFTAFDAGSKNWSAYVEKTDALNETFDFVPAQSTTYYIVLRNERPEDANIHMQLRYKL